MSGIRRRVWDQAVASVEISMVALMFLMVLVLPLAPGARAATVNVKIVDFAFQLNSINVQLGDTVIWTNNGTSPHTVTSDGGAGPLDSPTLNNGDTYQFTFLAEGTYSYHCTFHSGSMKGTVTVGSVVPEFSNVALIVLGLAAMVLTLSFVRSRH